MNTIIIDEKTVSVDGVIFERKEPEFKVGQWVVWSGCHHAIGRILRKCNSFSDSYALEVNGDTTTHDSCNICNLRPATYSEIESHLIKVAREKYKNGSCVRSAKYNGKFNYDELRHFEYESAGDILWAGGMILYYSGKWAEIVPTKKPLPKTKEEFNAFLGAWNNRHTHSTNEFLEDYE